MQFRDFENHFQDHQLITTQTIRNAFGEVRRVQLSRWESKGWLTRIRQGQYLLSSQLNKVDRELLANEIKNSYISLEYALNHHNLIPEIPQKITSITTERSETVNTPLGTFTYQKIKPKLFCGYTLKKSRVPERQMKMASATKALFDWVYLGTGKNEDSFEEARFNTSELANVFELREFENWLESVSNPTIRNRLEKFLSFLKNNVGPKAD